MIKGGIRMLKILKSLKSQAAFTLIEVMIVVVILGFLAATVGPELFSNVSKAEISSAKHQLDNFKLALDNYRLDNGRYPSTEQGLEALIEAPTISPLPRNWNGPYLEEGNVPLDPWGSEYMYKNPGEHNSHKYDLWSKGSDLEADSDDITNW